MIKYSFNQLLLSKLPVVMDISISEIARRCNISQPVIYNYIKGSIELPLKALIQICNALRIPSRLFISENNRHVIPTRETATIEADQWKPITWNTEAVELTFGDGENKTEETPDYSESLFDDDDSLFDTTGNFFDGFDENN